MTTELPRPTAAELQVLDVLWRLGAQTVRGVASDLHGDPSPVQYRTVQVLLDRLEKKGLVARDRSVTPQSFAATVDRSGVIGNELQDLADRICEGALAPLLLNLADRARLSPEEKARLWKLLEEEV
ncbi:MAG: BlaI/MecI/CopY family transcriptional regulator [Planctomycetota bacterium]